MPVTKNTIACPGILKNGDLCNSRNTRCDKQAYVEVHNCQVKRMVCDDCKTVFNVVAVVSNIVKGRGDGYAQVAKKLAKKKPPASPEDLPEAS